jgi:cephalosporin hydroxylase
VGYLERSLLLFSTLEGALTKELEAVRKRSAREMDICDHLETIFLECLNMQLGLIVELGVGDGESTFVLERVARLWKAKLISVDIADCRKVSSYHQRIFVQKDDIEFAQQFNNFCKVNNMDSQIDILFIDTSHLYDHTVQEIRSWFPFLASRSNVIFHDTNMKEVFHRKNGSTGRGWNNERGVIRAIEGYFSRPFNEEADFAEIVDGWFMRHYAHCNGLMIMERYGK